MSLGGRYRLPGMRQLPRRKQPWWREPSAAKALEAEYQRVLPALTAAYNATTEPTVRRRMEEADNAFGNKENPLPLIRWARTVVPGIFSLTLREHAHAEQMQRLARLRVESEARFGQRSRNALERPPSGPLYHGTNAHDEITSEGLCVSSWADGPGYNSILADSDYGWLSFWREEVWHSYRHGLQTEQRRQLHRTMGLKGARFKKWMLDGFAVFWATRSLRQASEYARGTKGVVLEIDPSQIDYYWFFGDELAGGEALVFVCPDDCPQIPPSGLAVLP